MTDKKRQLPDKIVDADGRPTLDFIAWADDLIYGTAADSIGTLLSGRNADSAKITGIIAGTQPLADVTIQGVGSVTAQQEAQDATFNAFATLIGGGGALTAYADRSGVGGTRVGVGMVTSNFPIVITASGGTAPYTYAWTKRSGDAISAITPSSNSTYFNATITELGQTLTATFRCTVTDSAGSPATFDVDVAVGLSEIT